MDVAAFLVSPVGAPGAVATGRAAPLPEADVAELPMVFTAVTLALTGSASSSKYGASRRVEISMEQLVEPIETQSPELGSQRPSSF